MPTQRETKFARAPSDVFPEFPIERPDDGNITITAVTYGGGAVMSCMDGRSYGGASYTWSYCSTSLGRAHTFSVICMLQMLVDTVEHVVTGKQTVTL